MKLAHQTALVTGGASGLGEACVRHFVSLGIHVLFLDLSDEKGMALAEELGPNAVYCRANVTSEEEVRAAIAALAERWGRLDIVCNVAGINVPCLTYGKKGPHPLDSWARVIDINLVGTYNVMRLAAEKMADNEPGPDGQRGVIVNTSSVAAFHGEPGQTAYSASKGGINALTLPAARELARYGIRVCAIAPGLFETPIYDSLAPEVLEGLKGRSVFPKRLGRPAEFAQAVAFAVENPMLNGTVLRLDGAVRF